MPATSDDRGGLARFLRRLLALPAEADLDVDDPGTTARRRVILRNKPFLLKLYREWYASIAAQVGEGECGVLELGSGAGFLKDIVRDARTSEVFWISGADLVCDARSLPVRDDSLRALVLVDVAHHVAAPRDFLREASRALRPGGRIVMIEPWVTPWSRFVYTCFHHEPFRPEAETWEFATTGPLSGANGALPWIIFERDRAVFEREHPALRIASIEPMMPFRYLLSGGVSMRALVPSWSFPLFRALEQCLAPLISRLAMFALIVVERRRLPEKLQE